MYLNCHTVYSLRYGTLYEKQLLDLAHNHYITALPLTDINNTSAHINFAREATLRGIKPILGVDFRNGIDQQFIVLSQNPEGYRDMNDFLSFHLHGKTTFPRYAPTFQNCFVIYPFEKIIENPDFIPSSNEYIGIRTHELNRLPFLHRKDWLDRLVVLQTLTFATNKEFNTHRLLRAIDNNTLLSKLAPAEQASKNQVFVPPDQIEEDFRHYPHILAKTQSLLQACSTPLDTTKDETINLSTYTGSTADDLQLLQQLCEEGLYYRYGSPITPKIRERLAKELDLIQQMHFVPYFLINWDITSFARNRGYFYVGRGSGANSIVAYLLRITDVDPMELDLYFERFMNLFRTSPPDFDIDFSWQEREEVTRYIFRRFGKDANVALLATYNTFQYSASVRELGKVFGLPKNEIDALSRHRRDPRELDGLTRLVHIYAERIHGMPNYRSVHAGGILLSDQPIHYYTATDMPPKGFPTTQFDMIVAEDIGLYKLDILSQRGLAKIKDAITLISENQPERSKTFDIHNVRSFFHDPQVNNLIKEGRCLGCFYVESPAMRMLLKKLEVDSYLGLVAASSIIRPGVAKSGMMREYILRHKNPSRRQQAHPVMLDLMPDTYGVMVYQEDVIKVAHYFADLSLSEADVLRRGMSGKYRSRSEFDRVKDKFFVNCTQKGYSTSLIEEVWFQIESFAGYAFAKGHSASYAVESYQCLYLKAYFPLEYMVAVLNNGGGFYRPEIYVHELRMLGAQIEPPCVNQGEYATVIRGKIVVLGMMFLAGMERSLVAKIVQERKEHGLFASLHDFLERMNILDLQQIVRLIRVGAFRYTGEDKKTLLWKAHYYINHNKKSTPHAPDIQTLFERKERHFTLPAFDTDKNQDAFDQIELLGFPLCHPFSLLQRPMTSDTTAKDFFRYRTKNIAVYGYLVARRGTKTSSGQRMLFATFLDYDGELFDVVLFPKVASQYHTDGIAVYRITGKVVEEFGFLSIEAHSLQKQPFDVPFE